MIIGQYLPLRKKRIIISKCIGIKMFLLYSEPLSEVWRWAPIIGKLKHKISPLLSGD